MIGQGSRLLTPTPFKAGLLCVLLACLLYLSFGANKPALLRALDQQLVGAMFRWRGAESPRHKILIVDIDETSLAHYGQWPWPRDLVARLVTRLHQQGARVIGLDMMFIEADRSSPIVFLQKYPQLARLAGKLLPELDHDQLLGQALAESPSVLGYTMLTWDDGLKRPDAIPFPSANLMLASKEVRFNQLRLMQAYRATANLPAIAQAQSEGFLNFFPETTGAVDRVPLLINLDGIPYPSLALEVARIALKEQSLQINPAPPGADGRSGLLGLTLGKHFIPTDDQGQMSINYRGPWRSFDYLSVKTLLEGDEKVPELDDAIVLIGTSAVGLLDLQTTPFSRILPGVEIHANIIDNLLSADPLRYDIFTEIGITISLILIGGLLLGLLLACSGPLSGALGAFLIILLAISGNYLVLFRQGTLVGLTYPLLTILLICLVVTLANYLLVARQKQFIQGAFGHYLSPQVVAQLLRDPNQLSLAGEQRELSVLFCDIRNFTSISEGMDSAELTSLMNRYLTEMCRVITAGRGMIDKFIGDAIMAIWGAPLEDPAHPLQAVRSALEMQERTAELRKQWLAEGLPEIRVGIGINTGLMRVGNFGSEELFDYTVIGDQVNLASRLEGLNRIYGSSILIGEHTWRLVKEEVACRPIDLVRVKGRNRPVEIYEPLQLGGVNLPELDEWRMVLQQYRKRDFEEARRKLTVLNSRSPHPLYHLYLDRIKTFLQTPPPPDWDGCFQHLSK